MAALFWGSKCDQILSKLNYFYVHYSAEGGRNNNSYATLQLNL